MKKASHLMLILILAVTCRSSVAAKSPARYVFTDLGEEAGGRPAGINNLGQVAIGTGVWTPDKANGTSGRFWDVGVIEPRGPVDPEFNGVVTFVFDINDRGEVVGVSGSEQHYKNYDYTEPFRTRVGKKLDRSCTMSGKGGGTTPLAINNHGVVVGVYQDSSTSHAAKWSSDGRGASLGKLRKGDRDCAALGINDRGTIVGDGEERAWVLDGMHKRDLGVGRATAVNNHGVVAGMSFGRACIWVGAKRHWLDRTRYPRHPGCDVYNLPEYSIAEDINDAGQAVGYISVYIAATDRRDGHYEERAALWSNGKTIILNEIRGIPPGTILESAEAINNKGQIVGCFESAVNPGLTHSFLLTPIKVNKGSLTR